MVKDCILVENVIFIFIFLRDVLSVLIENSQIYWLVYSETLLSQTRWNCLNSLRYLSIRNIEG